MAGRIVIAVYRPKPGKAAALEALVAGHVPALHRLGLATARAPIALPEMARLFPDFTPLGS